MIILDYLIQYIDGADIDITDVLEVGYHEAMRLHEIRANFSLSSTL